MPLWSLSRFRYWPGGETQYKSVRNQTVIKVIFYYLTHQIRHGFDEVHVWGPSLIHLIINWTFSRTDLEAKVWSFILLVLLFGFHRCGKTKRIIDHVQGLMMIQRLDHLLTVDSESWRCWEPVGLLTLLGQLLISELEPQTEKHESERASTKHKTQNNSRTSLTSDWNITEIISDLFC